MQHHWNLMNSAIKRAFCERPNRRAGAGADSLARCLLPSARVANTHTYGPGCPHSPHRPNLNATLTIWRGTAVHASGATIQRSAHSLSAHERCRRAAPRPERVRTTHHPRDLPGTRAWREGSLESGRPITPRGIEVLSIGTEEHFRRMPSSKASSTRPPLHDVRARGWRPVQARHRPASDGEFYRLDNRDGMLWSFAPKDLVHFDGLIVLSGTLDRVAERWQ